MLTNISQQMESGEVHLQVFKELAFADYMFQHAVLVTFKFQTFLPNSMHCCRWHVCVKNHALTISMDAVDLDSYRKTMAHITDHTCSFIYVQYGVITTLST